MGIIYKDMMNIFSSFQGTYAGQFVMEVRLQ